MGEKRKNEARGRFQWWLLVIGFVLGVGLMVSVSAVQNNTETVNAGNALPYSRAELELTATALMNELQPVRDPLLMTATAMAATDADHPFVLTATRMVREATATALSSALTNSP